MKQATLNNKCPVGKQNNENKPKNWPHSNTAKKNETAESTT